MSSRLVLAMSASALAVALLGATPLGHAIVSNVPRNSVGPLELKRNAVTARKLSPNAVRTGHVLDGSLLAADFKAGQLPKGDKGEPGPPGLSGYEIVTAQKAVANTTANLHTANCPSGKKALGGGATSSISQGNLGPYIYVSRPTTDGNGWTAGSLRTVAGSWTIFVYAVCARVS